MPDTLATDEHAIIRRDQIHMLIQNPLHRVQDPVRLVQLAKRAYDQNRDDFIAAASCLCVIGYRALESGLPECHPDYEYCIAEGDAQLAKPDPLLHGWRYRWFVSLNLMLGYIHIARGALNEAERLFARIVSCKHRLVVFPNMVTNSLKACMLLGIIRAMRGDDPGALAAWDEAQSILRIGVPHLKFYNFWTFADLVTSGALARETFQLAFTLRLKLGLAQQPPIRIPEGRAVDPACLGFLGVRFLNEGRLRLPQ